jgi:hypothetical protein
MKDSSQNVFKMVETVEEHSRKFNNGDVCYPFVVGFLQGIIVDMANGKPLNTIMEELEYLK